MNKPVIILDPHNRPLTRPLYHNAWYNIMTRQVEDPVERKHWIKGAQYPYTVTWRRRELKKAHYIHITGGGLY